MHSVASISCRSAVPSIRARKADFIRCRNWPNAKLVNVKYLFHRKYSQFDTMALTENHQSSFAYFAIVLVWKVSMAEWWRVSTYTSVVPRRFPLAFCLLPRIPCHGEQNHQCCEIFGCCHGIVAYYMYKNCERFKLLNSQLRFS